MKTIPLTQGKEALVDDEDYDALIGFKWYAHRQRRTYYAARTAPGSRDMIRMHQVVFGVRDGYEIDHIDGNGLNNQKSNLRFLTHAHNLMNSRKRDGDYSSQYKGVSYDKDRRKWAVYLWVNKKRWSLGRFRSETSAAKAYDRAAREAYGQDVACLNFPEE